MAEERRNIGDCPFCKQSVFASQGQSVKWLKMLNPFSGELEKEAPTHKVCRKKGEKIIFRYSKV